MYVYRKISNVQGEYALLRALLSYEKRIPFSESGANE
jgi:hypothetical protein